MKYTTSFRNSVLKKILPPSNRSVSSVSKETGVAVVTINNWHGLHSEHLPLFRQELNELMCQQLFNFLFDINMIIYYIYICIVLTMVEQAGNEKTSQYRGSVQITQPFVF